MNAHDTELLQAILHCLKSRRKAEQIIQRYYRDKITLVWKTTDVHRAANEREVALTNSEAIKVLQTLHHQHNPQYGIKWEDLTTHIEDRVLGRKLTQAEIKRFVSQDIITVQK